jgi:hypothetical protein
VESNITGRTLQQLRLDPTIVHFAVTVMFIDLPLTPALQTQLSARCRKGTDTNLQQGGHTILFSIARRKHFLVLYAYCCVCILFVFVRLKIQVFYLFFFLVISQKAILIEKQKQQYAEAAIHQDTTRQEKTPPRQDTTKTRHHQDKTPPRQDNTKPRQHQDKTTPRQDTTKQDKTTQSTTNKKNGEGFALFIILIFIYVGGGGCGGGFV